MEENRQVVCPGKIQQGPARSAQGRDGSLGRSGVDLEPVEPEPVEQGRQGPDLLLSLPGGVEHHKRHEHPLVIGKDLVDLPEQVLVLERKGSRSDPALKLDLSPLHRRQVVVQARAQREHDGVSDSRPFVVLEAVAQALAERKAVGQVEQRLEARVRMHVEQPYVASEVGGKFGHGKKRSEDASPAARTPGAVRVRGAPSPCTASPLPTSTRQRGCGDRPR